MSTKVILVLICIAIFAGLSFAACDSDEDCSPCPEITPCPKVTSDDKVDAPDITYSGIFYYESKLEHDGKDITPSDAYQMLTANEDRTYIVDVRTRPEYYFVGHPAESYNIPLYEWGKLDYSFEENADFKQALMDQFNPDTDTLIFMCRSGMRSCEASSLAVTAGFSGDNVYNMLGGFEGDTVKDDNSILNGKRMIGGWINEGLPWEYSLRQQLLYQIDTLDITMATSSVTSGLVSRDSSIYSEIYCYTPKLNHDGKDITPSSAYEMAMSDPDHTFIIDVRTRPEYEFLGHPVGSYNLPYLLWTGQLVDDSGKLKYSLAKNDDFSQALLNRFDPDADTLIFMCRSGKRSSMSSSAAAAAGFSSDNIYNMLGGFEGDGVENDNSVLDGKRVIGGWINEGLPWNYELD